MDIAVVKYLMPYWENFSGIYILDCIVCVQDAFVWVHNLWHLHALFVCVFLCVCVWARVQVTLSGRDIDKGVSVRMSGAQISAIPSNEAEGSVL